MLGDGHLRFAHGAKGGIPTGNALFAMTLKNLEYISYLYFVVYPSIMTPSLPRAWPNPKTGLPVQQYTINSRSTPFFT